METHKEIQKKKIGTLSLSEMMNVRGGDGGEPTIPLPPPPPPIPDPNTGG